MNDSDITITQGQLAGRHMFDYFKTGEMRKEQNRSYRNTGKSKFEDSSVAWGLDHVGVTYGAASADLDGDGDLDIVEVNLEEPNFVLRNDAQEGNRIVVKLTGVKSNSHALGAKVIVKSAAGSQMRQVSPQSGYHTYNEDIVHFGLGKDVVVDELTVSWPGGGTQTLKGLKANMRYTITQPANGGDPMQPLQVPATLFAASKSLDVLNSIAKTNSRRRRNSRSSSFKAACFGTQEESSPSRRTNASCRLRRFTEWWLRTSTAMETAIFFSRRISTLRRSKTRATTAGSATCCSAMAKAGLPASSIATAASKSLAT